MALLPWSIVDILLKGLHRVVIPIIHPAFPLTYVYVGNIHGFHIHCSLQIGSWPLLVFHTIAFQARMINYGNLHGHVFSWLYVSSAFQISGTQLLSRT